MALSLGAGSYTYHKEITHLVSAKLGINQSLPQKHAISHVLDARCRTAQGVMRPFRARGQGGQGFRFTLSPQLSPCPTEVRNPSHLDMSSNLMEYPTFWPSTVPISSATLLATDMAATLLGWVHAIAPPLPANPPCRRNWGI